MKKILVILAFSFLSLGINAQIFKATFEDGNTGADIGTANMETEGNGETFTVLANPDPDAVNSSDYVLEMSIPPKTGTITKLRSEYGNTPWVARYPTEGHTHIYTWKRYYPTDFFDDADIAWMVLAQWATTPCNRNTYPDEICGTGGIFNDIELDGTSDEIRFRVTSDCTTILSGIPLGEWVKYVLEIHWSTSTDGWYKLYKNGALLVDNQGVQTLMDSFASDGSCDIYFKMGMYSSWYSEATSKTELVSYMDDYYVYDSENDIETLEDVCPECEGVTDAISVVIQDTTVGFTGYVTTGELATPDYATGNGQLNTANEIGAGVIYDINFPAAGTYRFNFGYMAGIERPAILYVDDVEIASYAFEATAWGVMYTEYVDVAMSAGNHTIKLVATTDYGLPNIDYLEVISYTGEAVIPLSSTEYSDETYFIVQADGDGFTEYIVGGYVDTNYNATGDGALNTTNSLGAGITYDINVSVSGVYRFYFAYTCGSTANRTADLYINSSKVSEYAFTSTGTWGTWSGEYVDVYLEAGDKTVSLISTTSEGLPNIDYLTIDVHSYYVISPL